MARARDAKDWAQTGLHGIGDSLYTPFCGTDGDEIDWAAYRVAGGPQLGGTHDARLTRIWEGRLGDAIAYAQETGLDRISDELGPWFTRYPGRPEYFSHWGEAFRYAASVLGLPTGDYPHSRPPQGILPEAAKAQIRATYERLGLVKRLVPA